MQLFVHASMTQFTLCCYDHFYQVPSAGKLAVMKIFADYFAFWRPPLRVTKRGRKVPGVVQPHLTVNTGEIHKARTKILLNGHAHS